MNKNLKAHGTTVALGVLAIIAAGYIFNKMRDVEFIASAARGYQ